MDWVIVVLLGVLGAAVGSFLNVCADRLPAGQSLLSPPSHCPRCNTRLKVLDLVPVFSYLALRGNCRYCSARMPFRIMAVEMATGALFAFIWARYGLSYQSFVLLVYVSLFLVVFVTDVEKGIIPNVVVIPGFLAALVLSSFWPGVGPVKSAIGAALGFGFPLAIYLFPARAIGEGDVKLGAMVGAATGFPLVAVSLVLAFVSGGVVALALLVAGKRRRGEHIAFGNFMAAAAVATLFWGEAIRQWYVERFWPF